MKNVLMFCVSLLPFLCILFFADPNEGMFSKNFGSLSTSLIFGGLAYFVLIKYSKKNAFGASIAWSSLLAIGLWVASLF